MKDTSGLLDLREVRRGRRTGGHAPLTAGDPANPLVRTSSVVPAPAVQDICAATNLVWRISRPQTRSAV